MNKENRDICRQMQALSESVTDRLLVLTQLKEKHRGQGGPHKRQPGRSLLFWIRVRCPVWQDSGCRTALVSKIGVLRSQGGKTMSEPTPLQLQRGCRYFSGIQNKSCKAGVSYRQFLYENYSKFPCLVRQDGAYTGACSAFAWWSESEIEAQEKRISEALECWLRTLANDLCPECGAAIAAKRQVGRCVYASPCGHRLYQGKLDPNTSDDDYEAQALE